MIVFFCRGFSTSGRKKYDQPEVDLASGTNSAAVAIPVGAAPPGMTPPTGAPGTGGGKGKGRPQEKGDKKASEPKGDEEGAKKSEVPKNSEEPVKESAKDSK